MRLDAETNLDSRFCAFALFKTQFNQLILTISHTSLPRAYRLVLQEHLPHPPFLPTEHRWYSRLQRGLAPLFGRVYITVSFLIISVSNESRGEVTAKHNLTHQSPLTMSLTIRPTASWPRFVELYSCHGSEDAPTAECNSLNTLKFLFIHSYKAVMTVSRCQHFSRNYTYNISCIFSYNAYVYTKQKNYKRLATSLNKTARYRHN